MPDLGSTLSLLFTKLEITEPTFTDLVLLYRKSKSVLDRPGSDKDQLPNWNKVSCTKVALAVYVVPNLLCKTAATVTAVMHMVKASG